MIADDFRPMFVGMLILAIGFILYPLIGLWGLVAIIVIGVIGMWVGFTMIKSAGKEDKIVGKKEN